MPFFSVLIVNYNSGAWLKRALDSLDAQTFRDFDVCVIDNASSDDSAQKLPKHVTLLAQKKNLGFAEANNIGALGAKGEWIVLLNPDAYAALEWLEKLHAAILRHPETVMWSCTLLSAQNPELFDGTGDQYHAIGAAWRGGYGWPVSPLEEDRKVFAPCGAAAAYRRDVWAAAGGMDTQFFCYCEDVDLAFRLRLMGHHARHVADATVYHEGSGISKTHGDFALYHGTRNAIWVFHKNMPQPLYLLFLLPHLGFQVALLLRSLILKPSRARVQLRAMVDAYSDLPRIRSERAKIQQGRTASVMQIARALRYSIGALLTRAPDSRE